MFDLLSIIVCCEIQMWRYVQNHLCNDSIPLSFSVFFFFSWSFLNYLTLKYYSSISFYPWPFSIHLFFSTSVGNFIHVHYCRFETYTPDFLAPTLIQAYHPHKEPFGKNPQLNLATFLPLWPNSHITSNKQKFPF